jgi:multiple sugar transport system substrate-binding protein
MSRQIMKKIAMMIVACTLVLGLLAGCTGNGSGNKVTLQMIESLTSPARTETLKEILADFEKENPDIKVELISPPFDQADSKIMTMLGAKQALDVMEARDNNVAELVNNSYLEPLDTYAEKWSDYATVSGTAKVVGSIDDKLYFLANALYQRQMFYRKDWFDEAGIKVPTTYQEMYEAGKKLTDSSKNRYGFSFRGGAGSNSTTDGMILNYNQANADLEDPFFTKDGKTIFSTPEAKAAMELYVKIYRETSPQDSIGWGFAEQVQAFTSGVTAILLQDPDVIQTVQESMAEGTWATAPIPVGPTGKAMVSTGAAGWGMVKNSKHKDEAWKLIEFLSSPEQNTRLAKSTGVIPLHTTATSDPFFQSGPYKTLLDMTADADTFINYKLVSYPGSTEWGKMVMENNQAILLDKAQIDDTLKAWEKFWMEQKESQK